MEKRRIKELAKKVAMCLSSIRLIPHLAFYLANKKMVDTDLSVCEAGDRGLLWQLTFHRDFRRLFYKRVGWGGYFLEFLAPAQKDFFINSEMPIGSCCKLTHVHNTHLNAHSIGRNFRLFHNVTIGDSVFPSGTPTIGDNVTVCCGAIIIGDITIGNNVIIAAGAVVTKSVPNNCVVGGVPAKILKRL